MSKCEFKISTVFEATDRTKELINVVDRREAVCVMRYESQSGPWAEMLGNCHYHLFFEPSLVMPLNGIPEYVFDEIE